MDVNTILSILKDGGPYGVAALAIAWAIFERFQHAQCMEKRIEEAQMGFTLLAEVKAAVIANTTALESRKGYFERLGEQNETNARGFLTQLALIQQSLDEERRRRP